MKWTDGKTGEIVKTRMKTSGVASENLLKDGRFKIAMHRTTLPIVATVNPKEGKGVWERIERTHKRGKKAFFKKNTSGTRTVSSPERGGLRNSQKGQ